MLELRNVNAGYDKRQVLNDVSVKIQPGRLTVIMGPNGAGKSTLLKVMFGLLKPSSGEILLDGEPFKPQPASLVRQGIFMVPQGKRVFRNMTVLENIELTSHFWKDRSIFKSRLDEVLEHFPDLKSRLEDLAGNLSGGQQQMVAIARGLLNRPRLMLLDEPSIGLSPKLISDTFNKIKTLSDMLNTGFVIVEHNLKTLLPLTDYAYILDQGRVVYGGLARSQTLDQMTARVFEKKEA